MPPTAIVSGTELLDSLSPFEVAVWAFTPNHDRELHYQGEALHVITGKASYVWAGAVAHIVVNNPTVTTERVVRALQDTIADSGDLLLTYTRGSLRTLREDSSLGLTLVQRFLARFGAGEELDLVLEDTDAAINSLTEKEIIEDPLSRRLRKVMLSIALILPVNFTLPGPQGARYETIAWVYSKESPHDPGSVRVKVKEISEAVLDHLIPSLLTAADLLAGGQEPKPLPLIEAQAKLRSLGFYLGVVDGEHGKRTSRALRAFQVQHDLSPTGELDDRTAALLRKLAP